MTLQTQSAEHVAASIPKLQRVVMLERFGGPEALHVVRVSVPRPASGELLVRIAAASVQFTDVILRKGKYPDLRQKPPLVLGYDLVGDVVALGQDVTGWAIGDRVAALTMTGSYAQYRTVRASRVVRVPRHLDPAEVATLVLSWTTAYQLLNRDAKVKSGQKVLVLGASGAVGQALVVLARRAGCEVWAAAHPRHAVSLRELGATAVDSDSAEFGELLAGGFDAVFDGIGEDGFSRAWRAVGPRGHLSAFGFSAGVTANVWQAQVGLWLAKLWWWNAFSAPRTASFFSITSTRKAHPEWFVADLGKLIELLDRGVIAPKVGERIGLESVADAQARLERGSVDGKIVLMPNAPVATEALELRA